MQRKPFFSGRSRFDPEFVISLGVIALGFGVVNATSSTDDYFLYRKLTSATRLKSSEDAINTRNKQLIKIDNINIVRNGTNYIDCSCIMPKEAKSVIRNQNISDFFQVAAVNYSLHARLRKSIQLLQQDMINKKPSSVLVNSVCAVAEPFLLSSGNDQGLLLQVTNINQHMKHLPKDSLQHLLVNDDKINSILSKDKSFTGFKTSQQFEQYFQSKPDLPSAVKQFEYHDVFSMNNKSNSLLSISDYTLSHYICVTPFQSKISICGEVTPPTNGSKIASIKACYIGTTEVDKKADSLKGRFVTNAIDSARLAGVGIGFILMGGLFLWIRNRGSVKNIVKSSANIIANKKE